MSELKIGNYIKILEMSGEPQYKGKIGKVLFIDDAKQIHGTWGGCAIIPETDKFQVLDETRNSLFELSDKTQTSKEGINSLVEYYIHSLGWSEKQACDYATTLFESGTIDEIKVLGRDGKEV